ncbi:M1 family aminopeptidase [Flavobacterium aurantiibacter]
MMFKTIYTFELKRFFRSFEVYVYSAIFFLFAFFLMADSLGYFDALSSTTTSNQFANSPLAINSAINGLSTFIYFLLPGIIGTVIYRDYRYNVHPVMYSYPFEKPAYFFGKFLSGFTISIIITLFIGIGIYLATILPFANPDLLGPQRFDAYWQAYLYFVLPNMFFYGVIVFVVVTITRNASVGFLTVLILIIGQSVVQSYASDAENRAIAAYLDPFGYEALSYYTQYWTVYERNNLALPFEGYIIYNRLLWLGISLLILGLIYRAFSFSQNGITLFKSKKSERFTKENFSAILRVNLPEVTLDFSAKTTLNNILHFTGFELRYILKNWLFIVIFFVAVLFLFLVFFTLGVIFGTKTLPLTSTLLSGANVVNLFINALTFLFAGLLIHRGTISRMNLLVDSTPTSNFALVAPKFLALILMQAAVLFSVIIAGVGYQAINGFTDFELDKYFFHLYGIVWINLIIWACLALFVQSWVRNYLIGFFILLATSIVLTFLPSMGVEQIIFLFNEDPGYAYSNLDGYGATLPPYFLYKVYWLLLGSVLLLIGFGLYRRGISSNAKERLQNFKRTFTKPIAVACSLLFFSFIGLGGKIYYENNIREKRKTALEFEKEAVLWEKKYKKYENTQQPRIVEVNVNLEIYPETRDFVAKGKYYLKNKSGQPIDTLIINYQKGTTYTSAEKWQKISIDTVLNFDILKLEKALAPGDSLLFEFTMKNKPNTLFNSDSPILYNGTFINNGMFPSFGYNDGGEITDNDLRKKYNLPPKDRMPSPYDMKARQNTYISSDSDWIRFQATIGTAGDQIAIAPGYLQKQWKEKGRNYFHYKMDQKMLNFYAFNSGRYEVLRDKWNNVNIEIYYHKDHTYNLDRMVKGIKKGLDYYSANFSPYQHKQVRIIEFPETSGGFAQSFANTIPFSEGLGFVADVDDTDENAVDYPFAITAHEVAHQWWAHQVIGANVQGATVLSESLSEYSSLKVLEHQYGKGQMRKFLKEALDSYLQGRAFESKKEQPLMFNENQQYIHYNKGSLVLYALSDYIGEAKFNAALKSFIQKKAYQEAPYTTAVEFVEEIDSITPDSLKYLINDMFREITTYSNSLENAKVEDLKNGKYRVTINFSVTKQYADGNGKERFTNKAGKSITGTVRGKKVTSAPLADYIELGIFGKDKTQKEKALYLKKVKVDKISNTVSIIVNEKPTEVGIDPYNKLIDVNSTDNRKGL